MTTTDTDQRVIENVKSDIKSALSAATASHRAITQKIGAAVLLNSFDFESLAAAQASVRFWTELKRGVDLVGVEAALAEVVEQTTDKLLDTRNASRSTSVMSNAVDDIERDITRDALRHMTRWQRLLNH